MKWVTCFAAMISVAAVADASATEAETHALVSIRGSYAVEAISTVSGGIKRDAVIDGQARIDVEARLTDTLMLAASAFGLHRSKGGPAQLTGSLSDPSNIDGHSTLRLNTLFLEKTWGQGSSIRLGQLAADDEFASADTAGGLINGTFGWANMFAANLTSGGPAFPLPTPGARLALVQDELTMRVAVFDGNPAGRACDADPQVCNRDGIKFNTDGGVLAMAEAEWAGERSTFKLGAWFHSGAFADQHLGVTATNTSISLASPDAAGDLTHRGNWGVYAIADARLADGLSGFARIGAAPADRNLISFYADAGLGWSGTWLSDADVFTLGVSYSGFSRDAAALDRDLQTADPQLRIRSNEIVMEADYQAQVTPNLSLQPDVQYIVRPGGNCFDQDGNPARAAFVVGLRLTVASPAA